MHAVFTSGALLSLVFADSSQRMFLAPAAYTPATQTQDAVAYSAALGPYSQMSESVLPVQSVVPVEREDPAMSSIAVYAVAGALLCGAVKAVRKETAVAEPDLEAATSAASLAKVAILFSSGKSAGKPKTAARKPAPKKPVPKKKPAPKRVAKPVTRSTGTGKKNIGGQTIEPGFQRFAKNLFSKENWAVQAFSILSDLPNSKGQDVTNTRR